MSIHNVSQFEPTDIFLVFPEMNNHVDQHYLISLTPEIIFLVFPNINSHDDQQYLAGLTPGIIFLVFPKINSHDDQYLLCLIPGIIFLVFPGMNSHVDESVWPQWKFFIVFPQPVPYPGERDSPGSDRSGYAFKKYLDSLKSNKHYGE